MISFGITLQGLRLLMRNFSQDIHETWGFHGCADSYYGLGVMTRN